MRRYMVFILIYFILTSLVLARKEVSFDEKAAMSHIRILASDEMEGRKSGLPGAARAEEYIASKFREWGLEPAGDNGTFFQNFTMEFRHVEEGVVFRILTDREKRDFTYGEDWRVERYSGSGHFTAEVVFAGYGIHAPEKGYDDYAGVDVKDKIVLISGDTPSRLKDKLMEEARMDSRIKAAQKLGALGVMSFREERGRGRYRRTRLRKAVHQPDFVILSVDKRVADFVFKDLPTEVTYLLRKVNRTSKPASFHTGVKVFVSVNALFEQARPTRNVLAVIEGTDSKLKGECLVIGAHMDHLGIRPTGEVMNGANDNASGTAVVMEVARVLSENRFKPKRTIIFGLWAGEEQGLWGSRHYVEHPIIPLEKTVVYINLDMVGIGRSRIPFQGVYYGPEIWQMLKKKLPPPIAGYISPGRGGPSGSDHASFLRKGVPGFYIIQPPLLKYHQSRDDSDLIDPRLLKKTGDFVLQAAEILASDPTDFLQPMREERYQFKYQKLINFRLSSLDEFIEHHIEARDSDVDVQLAVVGAGGAKGDELRVDILKRIIAASENIKRAGGLTFYSSSQDLFRNVYRGRTTVLPGLDGISAIADMPEWAQVLEKQGLFFVLIDGNSTLFGDKGLTEKGKKVLRALNQNGLLVMARGLNPSQAEALLKDSQDPLILLSRQIPGKGVLELIRKSKSALGLILGQEELPSAYFKRLDEAKESLSTDHLLIVNEQCLWGEEVREQMLGVISEILKAKYERTDISNLFSESFLRILKEVRREGEQAPAAFIPF